MSLPVDVGMSFGVPVLPAVVYVYMSTWVAGVDPFIVQVYIHAECVCHFSLSADPTYVDGRYLLTDHAMYILCILSIVNVYVTVDLDLLSCTDLLV